METFLYVIVILVAYFIGNISPAIIIGKIKGIDIRTEGSGNAGTTNVLRVLGKKAALTTLIVDILKGFVAVLIGFLIAGYSAGTICALAVFIGHIWPVLYKFKGGKGAATAFGAVLQINWIIALIALGIAAIVLIISKRMSAGSIASAITLPAITYFMEPDFFYVSLIIVAVILFKHKANIARLIKGEEPKLSFKK